MCTPDHGMNRGDSPHPHSKEGLVGPSCLRSQDSHWVVGVGGGIDVEFRRSYLQNHIMEKA